jgi:hypothetical protein
MINGGDALVIIASMKFGALENGHTYKHWQGVLSCDCELVTGSDNGPAKSSVLLCDLLESAWVHH